MLLVLSRGASSCAFHLSSTTVSTASCSPAAPALWSFFFIIGRRGGGGRGGGGSRRDRRCAQVHVRLSGSQRFMYQVHRYTGRRSSSTRRRQFFHDTASAAHCCFLFTYYLIPGIEYNTRWLLSSVRCHFSDFLGSSPVFDLARVHTDCYRAVVFLVSFDLKDVSSRVFLVDILA